MSSKRHFTLFLLFLSSTYAKELTNLREGQDLPLDRNDELADLKVYVRQNQEDLEILSLDMDRQVNLLQVLNDNVEKQNDNVEKQIQELRSENAEQFKELKSENHMFAEQIKELNSENVVFAEKFKDVYNQLKLLILDGYTMDPSTGNYFKMLLDKTRTWMEAKARCKQDGGELASIRNDREWQFVKGILTSSGVNYVWLGASDIATEDTWVWTDGSPVTYTDWRPGQPGTSTSYNCLGVYRGHNWQWYDGTCTDTDYAMCKIPA